MSLQTTCIGAYPKPGYVPVRDWFQGESHNESTGNYESQIASVGSEDAEAIFVRAAGEVIADQVSAGIDVPTDGEVRRENYIHYHCRHLEGFDFVNRTRTTARDGACEIDLPTIRGPIKPKGNHFLPSDFKSAQVFTNRPLKVTVPGPLTVADTSANEFYDDPVRLGADLADAINFEVRALAEAGCRVIQIDEPLFARKAPQALDYGIEHLMRCFHGVPDGVTKVMHMCCGYPNYLDQTDYAKADPKSYFVLADAVDAAGLDQISIEDAHRHNDLALLERFTRSKVIFGAVAIAQSQVESVEEISERLKQALGHIDKDRLIAAPDCGLGFLGRDLAWRKLRNLCLAAQNV
ncbi:cobalamin-independent methionine synthase II family protein [Pelagibius sp. Alg239-R121]|uniref:cobalamin-independent methionine synthase II family protein n=1 Tax=Pelagibius sp. Alg239-R121 TaxID=2993448 RepID=UPI0024A66590|nr:cobalamin-independent methionine synthase II family protein [Pelagibius sp. Alg239-R121]